MLCKIGRLTIVEEWKQDGRDYYLAICSCGTKKAMRSDYIKHCDKNDIDVSCGCRQIEHVRELGFKNRRFNYNRRKLLDAYKNMIERCYEPNSRGFYRYGGRGIKVCQEWLDDREQFIRDVGIPKREKDQIDRINTNGNYEPGNVRWVSAKENNRNRSNTRMVTAWGETKPLGLWCEITGVPHYVAKQRLFKLMWEPERALSEPWFLGKNQTYKRGDE